MARGEVVWLDIDHAIRAKAKLKLITRHARPLPPAAGRLLANMRNRLASMTAWRRRAVKRAGLISTAKDCNQEAAARGARLRELRWKNSAWLATAETIAGWNGFEIRNAGSGRSPVRKRSG